MSWAGMHRSPTGTTSATSSPWRRQGPFPPPHGASAILVLGLSTTGPPCFLSLPFPIGVFLPGNACSLGVCPESILPGFVVSGAAPCEGSASLSVAIPATAPPGAVVFAQWFVIDATVLPSPATLAASPSLLVTLL